MPQRLAPWTTWSADDLPCQFSTAQAVDNADLLASILPAEFHGRSGRQRKEHRLLQAWDAAEPNAYLDLNALAEDLRLVHAKRGFHSVLRELIDPNSFSSARHTIRVSDLAPANHLPC